MTYSLVPLFPLQVLHFMSKTYSNILRERALLLLTGLTHAHVTTEHEHVRISFSAGISVLRIFVILTVLMFCYVLGIRIRAGERMKIHKQTLKKKKTSTSTFTNTLIMPK